MRDPRPYGWTVSATFVVVVVVIALLYLAITLVRDRPWRRAAKDAEARRLSHKYQRVA